MTRRQTANIGIVLLIAGGASLLANLGAVGDDSLIGALLLGAGGVGFVSFYLRRQRQLWALPVGFAFFGVAVAAMSGALAGSYFLAFVGTGFALSYVRHPKHWWAVIPAGVLFTLALVSGVSELLPSLDPGFLFFAGLAATFGYLYTLPQGGKRWAIYPALATLVLAILSNSFTGGWLLPLLLMGGGIYILKRRADNAQNVSDKVEPTPEASEEDVNASVEFLERPSWKEVVEELKEPSKKKESL